MNQVKSRQVLAPPVKRHRGEPGHTRDTRGAPGVFTGTCSEGREIRFVFELFMYPDRIHLELPSLYRKAASSHTLTMSPTPPSPRMRKTAWTLAGESDDGGGGAE